MVYCSVFLLEDATPVEPSVPLLPALLAVKNTTNELFATPFKGFDTNSEPVYMVLDSVLMLNVLPFRTSPQKSNADKILLVSVTVNPGDLSRIAEIGYPTDT